MMRAFRLLSGTRRKLPLGVRRIELVVYRTQGRQFTAIKHSDYATVVIADNLSEDDVRRKIRQARKDGWTVTRWGLRDE